MFKKIKERMKAFDEFHQSGLIQIATDYTSSNPDDLMNCSKCGHKLGLWRMIFRAMQVERGEKYKVRCKHCKFVNIIRRSKLNETRKYFK